MAVEAESLRDTNSSADFERALKGSFDELTDFVGGAEFQQLVADLYALPLGERARFVERVVIDMDELRSRGIVPPDGIVVQRSAFADSRPTLFCVTKKLPAGHGWQKITVTFDNDGLTANGLDR